MKNFFKIFLFLSVYFNLILLSHSAESKKSVFCCTNLILGGFSNGKWITPENSISKIKPGDNYKLYNNSGFFKTISVTETYLDEQCESPSIEFKNCDYTFYDNDLPIASSAYWNILPRKAIILNNSSTVYQECSKQILASKKITAQSSEMSQFYKVDLEGDGIDEVLMNVTNLNFKSCPVWATVGDYSAIILRKLINGKVENIIIEGDFYNKLNTKNCDEGSGTLLYQHKIVGFFDLNNDGILEIITSDRYYEGYNFSVYEIKNGKPIKVLSNGWGV